jgi:zinc protease
MKNHSRITLFITLMLLAFVTVAATYKTQQWQTKNGVRVVFYPAKEVPILDISLAFAAGSAYDGNQFGLSALTTELLNQGSSGLTAGKIAEKIENTGGQYTAESSRDMINLRLRTLSSQAALAEATHALSLIINQPDFPEDAFNRQKNLQLMSIKQIQESPEEIANQTFFQALYGDHPYAHPIIGDATHVNALTREHVLNFYHHYFVGKNAVLVLVGAISDEDAHQLAETLVAKLPEGESAPPVPLAAPLKKAESIQITFPSSQTMIRIGQLGITHQNPHYFALQVGNTILGGANLVSKLAIELREKRGLTYGAYSQFSPMPGNGPFIISFSTRNKQAAEASRLTREILVSFIKDGPSEAQLEATQKFMTGSFPLSLASNQSIAEILLKIAFYHLPNDFLGTYLNHVNAVTVADVKQAFQAQISPNNLLDVSVGKN